MQPRPQHGHSRKNTSSVLTTPLAKPVGRPALPAPSAGCGQYSSDPSCRGVLRELKGRGQWCDCTRYWNEGDPHIKKKKNASNTERLKAHKEVSLFFYQLPALEVNAPCHNSRRVGGLRAAWRHRTCVRRCTKRKARKVTNRESWGETKKRCFLRTTRRQRTTDTHAHALV